MNCGDCTFCCKNTLVFILPGENYPYKTVKKDRFDVLDTKPNGDCIYLDNGCYIYKDRPQMCIGYSCIDFYNMADRIGLHDITTDKTFKDIVQAAIKRNPK